jgi:RNA polymerase sigma factor (sigma-70 family)
MSSPAGQPDREELLSAALLGAARALRQFDPGRGVPFKNYAIATILGTVLHALREWQPGSRREHERAKLRGEPLPERLVSLATPIPDAGQCTLGEALVDEEAKHDPERCLWLAEWQCAIRELPARLAQVVVLTYYEGYSQTQIAAQLGVCQMQVSRDLRRAHRRLLGICEAYGLAPEGWIERETKATRGDEAPQHEAPGAGRAEAALKRAVNDADHGRL